MVIPRDVVIALSLMIASAFIFILNETTLVVALPVIMERFEVTAAAGQWLTTGFMLTLAVVIPTTGYLLQRLTTRQVFITSLSLFLGGSVLAASAPTFWALLAGRVVQASGTGLMLPLLMTSVMSLVPVQRRGAVMGLIGVVIAAAPALGPTVSGLILQTLGWRWVFSLMVPLGVASLVVGLVMVRNVGEVVRDRLDVPSVLLSAVGFGSTVLGLSTLGEAAGQPDALAQALVALAVGVVTLGVFTRRQLVLQRSGAPLLDLRPFLEARFTFSLLTMLLAMFAMFGSMIVLPIYLQNVHGYGTLVAGLVMLPGGLAMAVMSQVVGRLYDAFGSRWLVLPGALGLTSAAWTMTLYTPQTALWMIVVTQTALMVSLGLLFTPLFSDALGALEQRLTSHGSAILNTLQQLAGAAGTALAVTALSLGAGWSGAADQVTSLMAGARAAYLAGAVVSLGVVVAVMLQRRAVARAGV
ncbi:DHA2 family lincomycin resistance protein-like MFS transporter [Propioniferax innocua]|uniref:DHA2 family lincomycin resistance protein-like MFS transporter n=1 Tax=Propioniferax innocua TaxID=1753 RepID=A0A542ZRD1_9ACTN|nr:DHA2 family lincomycin resistance protein-like MFS transporter [Propioniferax innocua]